MDIKDFRYIVEVVNKGNLTEAAKVLYISQPSLSLYIQNLEERLGVKLFSRSKKKLELTYSGQRYIEYAKKIISLSNQLEIELQDINKLKSGKLTVGISLIRGSFILPVVLPIYVKEYPHIEVKIIEGTSTKLEEMLISHEIDVAILNYPFTTHKLEFELLEEEEIILTIPAENPISKLGVSRQGLKYQWMDLNNLRDQKFILLRHGQRMRQLSDALFKNAGYSPNIFLETSHGITAYNLSAEGMGLSFISDAYLRIDRKKTLNYFSIDPNRLLWKTVAAFPSKDGLSKAAKAFIELAMEQMQQMQLITVKHERKV